MEVSATLGVRVRVGEREGVVWEGVVCEYTSVHVCARVSV